MVTVRLVYCCCCCCRPIHYYRPFVSQLQMNKDIAGLSCLISCISSLLYSPKQSIVSSSACIEAFYASILIGRIMGLAAPSVHLSVCLSCTPMGFYFGNNIAYTCHVEAKLFRGKFNIFKNYYFTTFRVILRNGS